MRFLPGSRKEIRDRKATTKDLPARTVAVRLLVATLATIAAGALLGGALAPSGDAAATTSVRLLKDINPGTNSGNPKNLVVAGSALYFQATDGVHGIELWKTRGSLASTTMGTVMVKDINPSGDSSPGNLTALNGILYFTANDGTHGVELWKSNGTDAGTTLVKDIKSGGSASSSPGDLVVLNGTLYFAAGDGSHGRELWKSNGTTAGTVMVRNINAGSAASSPAGLIPSAGKIFFSAADSSRGRELWKSDGTAAGTVIVKNIRPGGASGVSNLVAAVLGSALYFQANDGTNGAELWKSDGTATGTVLVKNIRSGNQSSTPSSFIAANGGLFFVANDGTHGVELWKSNGTTAGTAMVKDINPSGSGGVNGLFVFGTTLVFQANDGVHGAELWKSDGTTTGTVMIKDINTAAGISSSNPAGFANLTGILYFRATDGVHGIELWKSDGSDIGTVMIVQVNPSTDSSPSWLTPFGNHLYFAATEPTHGTELWELGDFSPPQTAIRIHPKKIVRTKLISIRARFRFVSNEPGSRFACKLDKGKWKGCKSPRLYSVKRGKHTFQVRATDKAGNTDRTPAKWVWTVKRA